MIHLEENDSVAILRMEHGKVNAIDVELFTELQVKLRQVKDSPARAVIITGTGKAFSAGVDLFRVLNDGRDYVNNFVPVLVEGLRELFCFPKPVIAAVNGHAIAGGCIMACACDYRIAAAGQGSIGVPELLVGVPFPPLALEIVRFAVSGRHLQEVVYTGKYYSFAEAIEKGMIDEIAESENLLTRSLEVANQFVSISETTFHIVKQQLRAPYIDNAERLGADQERIRAVWAAPETHAAIRNYLQEKIKNKK